MFLHLRSRVAIVFLLSLVVFASAVVVANDLRDVIGLLDLQPWVRWAIFPIVCVSAIVGILGVLSPATGPIRKVEKNSESIFSIENVALCFVAGVVSGFGSRPRPPTEPPR